jgi:hypothetical protein
MNEFFLDMNPHGAVEGPAVRAISEIMPAVLGRYGLPGNDSELEVESSEVESALACCGSSSTDS